METMNNVVNYKKRFTRLMLSIILFGSLFGCSTNNVELKAKEFEIEVNKDVSLKADTYLNNVKKDSKITFKSEFNNKKIGSYDATINYGNKEYVVKIKVVDKEKPVVVVSKKLFVFKLEESLKDVNKTIKKEIKVTDNYDKEFNDIEFIDKLPTKEKEIVCKLKVKDTSNNVSDPIQIKVQFTKDGKEKSGLKQEVKDIESTVNKKENEKTLSNNGTDTSLEKKDDKTSSKGKSNKTSNTGGSSSSKTDEEPASRKDLNDNASDNSNQGTGNMNGSVGTNGEGNTKRPVEKPEEPVEPPRPSEQPSKPEVSKPQLTVANCPDMYRQGRAKLFASYDEAYNWWNTQYNTEGGPYYQQQCTIDEITDEGFEGVIYGVGF